MTIAVSMPGKMGDALYALPFSRLLYGINGEKIDFYTSDYCKPIAQLIAYQPYINKCIISSDYKIERMDMGCQPWEMPVHGDYSQVYHAGFRSVPDRAIHQFIAAQYGYNGPLGISYDYPKLVGTLYEEPYICIAPRGETTYKELFNEIAKIKRAIIIGSRSDYTGYGINATGIDMLSTLSILSRAKGFVGLMSSQLVLANGFPIPRIAPHDGRSWDMRHVINTQYNHYPINPSVEDIIALLDSY